MEEEKYISGYKSSLFQKVGQRKIGGAGYGIYATNKRIFLVKISVIESLADSAKGTAFRYSCSSTYVRWYVVRKSGACQGHWGFRR